MKIKNTTTKTSTELCLYLLRLIQETDTKFGKDYCQNNPELVMAALQTIIDTRQEKQ